MAASTVAALLALFKRLYVGNDLSNMALRDTPLFRAVTKKDDLDSEGIYVPINYGLPVGASVSLTTAQANVKASKVDRFFLQRNPFYGTVTIAGEAIHASRRDPAAFLRVKQKEADEALAYIGMQIGASFWGDGAGNIGQITVDPGTGGTATLTFSSADDTVNLHIGQTLQANPTRTGTAGNLRADKYVVDSIDRDAGTAGVTKIGSANDWAVNDYVYVDGNYDGMMSGVQAYIPASTPGTGGVPAALNGMTRTDDPNMKAGWRGDWQGTITESAERLAAKMGKYVRKSSSALWLSTYNWFRLQKEQESMGKVVRDQRSEAVFGTPSLLMLTPRGEVPVMADPFMPNDYGALLDHSTWEIHHLLGLPHMITDDGLTSLRGAAEDSIEIRFRAWVEAVCTRPFNNGRFTIS